MFANKFQYNRKDFIKVYGWVFIYIMSINFLDIVFDLKYNAVSGLLHAGNPLLKYFVGNDYFGMICLFIFGTVVLFINAFILKKISKHKN